jgi:hypothetical protein
MVMRQQYQTPDGAVESVGNKQILSKEGMELYHDEDNIKMPIIRVKHFKLPNKGERWKIFNDSKVVIVIEGSKLNKKEREFLRGLDGINFLIKAHKAGIDNFNALKKELKNHMKSWTIKQK